MKHVKIPLLKYLRKGRLVIFVAIISLLIPPCSRISAGTANVSKESKIKKQIEQLEKEKLYHQKKIEEVNKKIQLLQRELGYGRFSLLLAERYKRLDLSKIFLGGGLLDDFFSNHPVSKGMEVVLAIVKVKNDGERYIRQINAFVVDDKEKEYPGESYIKNNNMVIVDRYKREGKSEVRIYKRGERILEIKGQLECECKNIFYTDWVGVVNALKLGQIRIFPVEEEIEGIVRPGECYEWIFIFVIPENRIMKRLILNCGVAETPVGFPEIYKIIISLPKI